MSVLGIPIEIDNPRITIAGQPTWQMNLFPDAFQTWLWGAAQVGTVLVPPQVGKRVVIFGAVMANAGDAGGSFLLSDSEGVDILGPIWFDAQMAGRETFNYPNGLWQSFGTGMVMTTNIAGDHSFQLVWKVVG